MEESEAFDFVMTNMRDEVYKELYPEIREEVLKKVCKIIDMRVEDNIELASREDRENPDSGKAYRYLSKVYELRVIKGMIK